jgi:hypothetical protein
MDAIRPEEPVHENIRITENHFDRAGVNAMGARNLKIAGNRSPGGSIPIKLDPSCTATQVHDNEQTK